MRAIAQCIESGIARRWICSLIRPLVSSRRKFGWRLSIRSKASFLIRIGCFPSPRSIMNIYQPWHRNLIASDRYSLCLSTARLDTFVAFIYSIDFVQSPLSRKLSSLSILATKPIQFIFFQLQKFARIFVLFTLAFRNFSRQKLCTYLFVFQFDDSRWVKLFYWIWMFVFFPLVFSFYLERENSTWHPTNISKENQIGIEKQQPPLENAMIDRDFGLHCAYLVSYRIWAATLATQYNLTRRHDIFHSASDLTRP